MSEELFADPEEAAIDVDIAFAPYTAATNLLSLNMRPSLYTLAFLASVSSAARFTLLIPATQLVSPSSLPSTTHTTLQSSGPPLEAYITRSNSFVFNNVSTGSYLATIHCRDFAFEPLRIDVTVEEALEGSGEKKEMVRAWQTFIGNEWDNKGELRGEGGNGLVVEVRPLLQKDYYQERGGCRSNPFLNSRMLIVAVSPLSFLKNPMILMALFSMVLIFGMPYLVENSMFLRKPPSQNPGLTDVQWTRRPVPNSKNCRRRVPSARVPAPQPSRSRTLISHRGWLGKRKGAAAARARPLSRRSGAERSRIF